MYNKKEILGRLKQLFNATSEGELAKCLGISKPTLSNWYKRDSINYDLVFHSMKTNTNLNWLLTGKGEMLLSDDKKNYTQTEQQHSGELESNYNNEISEIVKELNTTKEFLKIREEQLEDKERIIAEKNERLADRYKTASDKENRIKQLEEENKKLKESITTVKNTIPKPPSELPNE